MNKYLLLFSVLILATSCSSLGLKRVDGVAQAAPPKEGVTWGGPVVGNVEVQKGYWCEVRGGVLTFGAPGPTEKFATEQAKNKCHDVFKDSPCDLQFCKANN